MKGKIAAALACFVCCQCFAGAAQAAGSGRILEKTFERLEEMVAQRERVKARQEAESLAANGATGKVDNGSTVKEVAAQPKSKMELATFGNGCFWCTEAVFEELHGVSAVMSGYSGGRLANPTYRQVCSGLTGHAEVIQLRYDPSVISYGKLLEAFFRTHDPTTLNRQGPDIGTQYRSAVFYHTEEQREVAELFKKELNKARAFRRPVVTEVTKFKQFYRAENYHQDYFELHGSQPYCQSTIRPKLTKFRRAFREELAATAERKKKNQAKKEKGQKQ